MPTLRYADDALRQFFATPQTMPWYRNTLFVITADHTADLLRNGETSGAAFDHWIPLLYFMPAAIRPEQHSRVTQQIDILPTVLDLVDYPKPFFAFGSSVLRQERMPAAASRSSSKRSRIASQAGTSKSRRASASAALQAAALIVAASSAARALRSSAVFSTPT